jgi:hypothetical protein
MIYSITASKDATIYEKVQEGIYSSSINTGIDEVLNIDKVVSSSLGSGPWNSRILIQFDIPNSVYSGSDSLDTFKNADGTQFTPPTSSLKLYAIDKSTNHDHTDSLTIRTLMVSQSWIRGNGRKSNKPITHNPGCSWKYTNGSAAATQWSDEYGIIRSGASTHSIAAISQVAKTYIQQTNNYDYQVDVTELVSYMTNSAGTYGVNRVENNGFLICKERADELSAYQKGNLAFFSTNTHTIYQPRLEFKWDDSNFATGSLSELDTTDASSVFLYLKNNRGNYKYGEKVKFRIQGREKYPVKTYGNTSANLSIKFLPSGSAFYSIKDLKTGESILPYDDNFTKLSCDSTGNYFEMFTSNLSPERYYQIEIKLKASGSASDIIGYYPIKDIFKVVR